MALRSKSGEIFIIEARKAVLYCRSASIAEINTAIDTQE